MPNEVLKIRKLADKSVGERVTVPVLEPLVLRNGEEVLVHTGENKLVNPDTPGTDHEPWPLAGVVHVGDLPEETSVSMKLVEKWKAEGFATTTGDHVVHRPGGPDDSPWSFTHTFLQYDTVTLHFWDEEGDHPVTYDVIHNPDKYMEDHEDHWHNVSTEGDDVHVDRFYRLRLRQEA